MEHITVTPHKDGIRMDVDRTDFALALHTWRLRAGLTQAQVGEAWGVSRYTIMRAERGKDITWQMAYRLFAHLADALKQEASNG